MVSLPKNRAVVLLFLFILFQTLNSGNVYLVIGSDTAIWDGMSTTRFNNFYNIDLYTNPNRNAYKIMDPAFRARLLDSEGQPLKMTWWMMAGNIFRYATNKNVPIPNIMTMYLMKKYHGENVLINGDELSLHYHTFIWSDFNGDGRYYWNQAEKFLDCLEDFNYTLAQFLLEENIFPVSFRSGWHYMDNDWQHYLDDFILPYTLHNDYPHKHIDTEEPIDNNYDWSLAPSSFVPFHPSAENYQLPGNGPGWNVRSVHFWRVLAYDYIDTVFAAAQKGQDQVACFWGHLPEKDFIENIEKIDSVAHARLKKYPDVKFYYCTATEALQRWRNCSDFEPPEVEFTQEESGEDLYFKIRTHEKIFQQKPFVAVKDIYETYQVLDCVPVGINTWRTATPIPKSLFVKAGVAVCDTFGNQTLAYIKRLPDEVFLDNRDENFSTLTSNWQTTTDGTPWGTDAQFAVLNENDSAQARWQFTFSQETDYNLFLQVPNVSNPAGNLQFVLQLNHVPIDTIFFEHPLPANEWVYLATIQPKAGDVLDLNLKVKGTAQAGKVVAADVLKISSLVRERDLLVSSPSIDFGEVSWGDTVQQAIVLKNLGKESLTIKAVHFSSERLSVTPEPPFVIGAMEQDTLQVKFCSAQKGLFSDTLFIESNDPHKSQIKLEVTARVENYFALVDNEDSAHYQEFSNWYYSVAHGYGGTSRYAWLNRTPRAYARFFTTLKKAGVYEMFEIVPKTENASNFALYEIHIGGTIVDSVFIDQNEGSGNWKSLGLYYVPAPNTSVEIRVVDTGKSTQGAVLRADAVKFLLIREITEVDPGNHGFNPRAYQLYANFPNPFNATTTIRFYLPKAAQVRLEIFNVLGQKIRTLKNAYLPSGHHQILWDGRGENGEMVSSGVYYYRMQAADFNKMKKMILLK